MAGASTSGVPSSPNNNNCSLVQLLGQELFQNCFGTGEDGSVLPASAVGRAADVDKHQVCALESLVDTFLLQASNTFETAEIPSNSITAEAKSCFADPMSEEDVAKTRRASVPKKTQADTKYCMRLWYNWSAHRSSRASSAYDLETVPDITQIDCETMQYVLVESLCVN